MVSPDRGHSVPAVRQKLRRPVRLANGWNANYAGDRRSEFPSSKPTAGPSVDAAGLSGPLGSGWSADDPDPGARAGKPTKPGISPWGGNLCIQLCGSALWWRACCRSRNPLDDESPVPPAGLLFGPCNQASATRLMQRACWHLRGLRGRQARRSRGAGKPTPRIPRWFQLRNKLIVCDVESYHRQLSSGVGG